MSTKKRLFGGNPSPKSLDFLDKLQSSNVRSAQPNTPINPSEIYLGEKSPFARMWTATQIQISGSEVPDAEIIYHSVNESKNLSYDVNDSTGENLKNPYLKPAAGITSVSSKSEGAIGALRRTTVQFIVHNKKDFETIYLPFFLRPGALVCVDFGWVDESKPKQLYDFRKILDENPNMDNFDKKIIEVTNDNFGNMEVCIGNVQKFDSNITELGSFECSLEIVSRNWSLLDAEVTDSNNLKFAFTNLLEDSIIKVLTFRATGDFNTSETLNKKALNVFSAEDYSKSALKFFDSLQDADGTLGVIDDTSKIMGVFYQDLFDSGFFNDTGQEGEGEAGQDTQDDTQDALYISWGFFEDVFLNNLTKSTMDKDGNRVLSDSFKVGFNSHGSYVRYDENIYKAQLQKLMKGEKLPNFLYPDSWEKTYNTNGVERPEAKQEKIDKEIPIREVFIRTDLIKKGFSTKQNINDALDFIIESINTDSLGIIKLKMTSPLHEVGEGKNKIKRNNDTQIGIFDANSKLEEPLFTFDLTAGVGFVKNADIKFQTPKAGMASMIAIQNLSSDEVFYKEGELKKLNALRILNQNYSGKSVFLKSLPDVGNPNKKMFSEELSFDFSMYKSEFNAPELTLKGMQKSFSEGLKNYKEEVDDILDDYDEEEVGEKVEPESVNKTDTDKIVTAKTPREYYMGLAKISTMFNSVEESISPILPIELSLTTYGNNCLNMGDIFNVNYLPNHYLERVFFQITGIDHKLSTGGWETTYQTIMRVRPQSLNLIGIDKSNIRLELTTAYAKSSQSHLIANDKMLKGLQKSIAVEDFRFKGFIFRGTKGHHIHTTKGIFESKHIGSDFGGLKTIQDVCALWAFTATIFDTKVVTLEGNSKMKILHSVVSSWENFVDNLYTIPPLDLIDDFGSWAHALNPLKFDVGLSNYEEKLKDHIVSKINNMKDIDNRINNGKEKGLIRPITKYRFDTTAFNKYTWVDQYNDLKFEEITYYLMELDGPSAENISCIPGFAIPDRILAKDGGGIKGFCEAFANHYINIFDGIPLSGVR